MSDDQGFMGFPSRADFQAMLKAVDRKRAERRSRVVDWLGETAADQIEAIERHETEMAKIAAVLAPFGIDPVSDGFSAIEVPVVVRFVRGVGAQYAPETLAAYCRLVADELRDLGRDATVAVCVFDATFKRFPPAEGESDGE